MQKPDVMAESRWVPVFVPGCLLAVFACSGSSNTTMGGPSGGPTNAVETIGGSTTGNETPEEEEQEQGDASVPDASKGDARYPGQDAAPEATPGVDGTGTIYVTQVRTTPTTYQGRLGAIFRGPGSALPPNCTRTAGVCETIVCTQPAQNAPDSLTGFLAGVIAAQGPQIPSSFSISPNVTTPGYQSAGVNRRIFQTGEAITASAAGRTIPAFTSPQVSAPAEITWLTPAFSYQSEASLAKSRALAVGWSGGANGQVEVEVRTGGPGSSGDRIVRCAFDAASGSGTIPASAMAILETTRGVDVFGAASFMAVNKATFGTGSFQTTLRVESSPGDSPFSVQIVP